MNVRGLQTLSRKTACWYRQFTDAKKRFRSDAARQPHPTVHLGEFVKHGDQRPRQPPRKVEISADRRTDRARPLETGSAPGQNDPRAGVAGGEVLPEIASGHIGRGVESVPRQCRGQLFGGIAKRLCDAYHGRGVDFVGTGLIVTSPQQISLTTAHITTP